MILLSVIKRDLAAARREPGEVLNPIVFFLVVVTLFPLGISPVLSELAPVAPGVVWIAALLATLLSLDMMLRADHESGVLEQMVLGTQPLFLVMLGKALAHWLLAGVPLVVLSPALGLMLGLPAGALATLAGSLLLATPVFSLLGSVAAGLTVGLRHGSVLVGILVLPLYVPLLILGTEAVKAAARGEPTDGPLLWLGAILALSAGFCPIVAAAGAKITSGR